MSLAEPVPWILTKQIMASPEGGQQGRRLSLCRNRVSRSPHSFPFHR